MMRHLLALSLRPGAGARSSLILPIVAFALVTALLVGLIGGAQTFWTWSDDLALTYQMLAVIALCLLVVPLTALGGAAARLSARRRDERLSTLRLLGVTSATVRLITVIESSALALIGSVAGIALSFIVLPLIALIPFRGAPLGFSAVVPPWWAFVAVCLGMVVLAAVSSVVSLRAVVISPLGVRTRSEAPRMSWLRPLIAVGVVIIAATLTGAIGGVAATPMVLIIVLAGCFGGAVAVLNLVGPWFLSVRAASAARKARTARRLLAARRVTEDPRAAWRQVSGVAMASFTAVFAGTGLALISGVDASEMDEGSRVLLTDMRMGVLITVLGSFIIVACAVGVSQAADIIDRAPFARSLWLLGAEPSDIEAARRRSVTSPLITTSVGAVVVAAVVLFPLVGATLIVSPLTLAVVLGVLALGCGIVWLGLRATTGLQRDVAMTP